MRSGRQTAIFVTAPVTFVTRIAMFEGVYRNAAYVRFADINVRRVHDLRVPRREMLEMRNNCAHALTTSRRSVSGLAIGWTNATRQ